MACVMLFLAAFSLALCLSMLIMGGALYVVYRLTGGKLSFRRWWREMDL